MIIKVKNEIGKPPESKYEFPKYTTQILNIANRNAQGTRPKIVGQMTDLIQEFPHKTFDEWKKWYLSKMPSAIDDSTEIVSKMVSNMGDAHKKIDEKMIREWIEDLVLVKTYTGLMLQKIILEKISTMTKKKYRLATPKEESKSIDGFVGNMPISIKPTTYKLEKQLPEIIDVPIIYYEIDKNEIKIEIDDKLFTQLSQS